MEYFRLVEYKFVIVYKPVTSNQIANILSSFIFHYRADKVIDRERGLDMTGEQN